MKLEFVKEIPLRKKGQHKLQNLLSSFANSEMPFAKIVFSDLDYKSPRTCYSCLRVAAKRCSHNIKVCMRGDDVFLAKCICTENVEKEGDE